VSGGSLEGDISLHQAFATPITAETRLRRVKRTTTIPVMQVPDGLCGSVIMLAIVVVEAARAASGWRLPSSAPTGLGMKRQSEGSDHL
jgi:hypothetical protein